MAIKRGVSLYSLQDSYYNGILDLEGCVKFVAEELGATGIELLAEQMPVGSYPDPSEGCRLVEGSDGKVRHGAQLHGQLHRLDAV